tara:strand:- start:3707 stop:5377 length:1671 start_codon:yes stop_codon:yes gene_type:complete
MKLLTHSITKGLGMLTLINILNEIQASRDEFNKSDWTFYIVSAGLCAFLAAYGIGANDLANVFGTSVGSKSLSVRQAIVLASIFEFSGAVLMGSNVNKTIRKGIADPGCFADNPGLMIYGMTIVTLSVGIWLVLASYFEMPVSTTHSCIGGIIGMTLMSRGHRCVIWNYSKNDYGNGTVNMGWENFPWVDGVSEIVVSWVISPVASGICAAFIYGTINLFILRYENSYQRAKIGFPIIVFITTALNASYWIIKGTNGQTERFGTSRLVREAKSGNLWPAIQISLIFGGICSGLSIILLRNIIKRIDKKKYSNNLSVQMQADVEDVEITDDSKGGGPPIAETGNVIKSYIKNKLNRDVHKDLKTNKTVGNIHKNLKRHDARTEDFFHSIQIFTACVDSFSHGSNDVSNAMGPFAAAYVAYNRGKVTKSAEIDSGAMLCILALGGVGMIIGLSTYGYKIMNAMGTKLVAITPVRGSCIELGAAMVVIYGSGQGWPLSTTHCQIGATVAVGLFEGTSGVNWRLFAKTCFGWIITLVIVGSSTAILVGPSPEPLKGEYCS